MDNVLRGLVCFYLTFLASHAHFHNFFCRSKATANDNEMAKKELAHLEQRFRAKVQQGQAPFFGQDIAENVSTPVNSGAIPQVSLPNLSQYGSQTNSAVTSFPWLFPPVTPQWFNGMGSNTLNMNVPILPNTLNPSINR